MMDYTDKIITQMPLYELWNAQGPVQAKRGRFSNAEAIKEILRTGPVRFVFACVCGPIQWIPLDECYDFWKSVKPNLSEEEYFEPWTFPGGFGYLATEWKCDSGETIILLEMNH